MKISRVFDACFGGVATNGAFCKAANREGGLTGQKQARYQVGYARKPYNAKRSMK
jgi:hypothetical protein